MDKDSINIENQVLIIAPDPALRKVILISLEQAGMDVKALSRYANALTHLQQSCPNVFIVDLDLRGGDPGKLIAAYRANRELDRTVVVALTTNHLKVAWRREYQPDAVIYKPFDMRYLVSKINALTEQKSIPAGNN
jgi:DNA-binding response OmpR family regulator